MTAAFLARGRRVSLPFSYNDLRALPELREDIERRRTQCMVLAPYDDWSVQVVELTQEQTTLCDRIPEAREIPLKTLLRRAGHDALTDLVQEGVVGIYAEQ